ncbi:MAG: efflux RND transporter periplasmic adaptor subunit [Lachnospiraceae bacterium]|nr:efflux RND transporter periplasmic adaptor subunit [Lachnospiraceae bacterium]
MRELLKKKSTKVIIVIALVMVAIIALVVYRKQASKEPKTEKVYQVEVMKAGTTGSDVNLTYTGLVQPAETYQCIFENVGTVEEVYVKKGDPVVEGQPLARIDSEDAQDRLNSANDSLDYAEESRDRAQKSYDDALVDYTKACSADDEYEDLQDAIKRRDEQQAKVNELKRQLDSTSQYKNTNSAVPESNPDYYALTVQYDSAQTTLDTYQRSVDTAQEAYDKKLKEGANSDDAKMQKDRLDNAENSLEDAKEACTNAQNNVDSAQKAVDKCTLKAQCDGYVVDLQAQEGAVSTPLIPAVVVASNDVVVNFGISQTDVKTLTAGMPCEIQIEDDHFVGGIKDIDVVPDETSRTYSTNVTIDVADPDVYLGELATVKINVGERTGIWLPIAVVLNDGKDYVYVVDGERAKRQYIEIEEVSDDMVLVTGTKNNQLIITEGMKLIRSGSLVSYKE